MNLSYSKALLLTIVFPSLTLAQPGPEQTLESAAIVLDEAMSVPGRQIPLNLLADAQAVAIIPNVVKGGFVVGVRHGRGVVLARGDDGDWNPPMFATLTGGSVGWQAGLQATDVILVFMTRRSVTGLMNGKFTIGADAAAAAGPVGRQASAATDARLEAEILSYSRSRGLFAGVSIDGSVLQLDHFAGSQYYQGPVTTASGQRLDGPAVIPPAAAQLMEQLGRYTGSPAKVVATTATRLARANDLDLARRQLESEWERLAAVLDEAWRRFLAPPTPPDSSGDVPISELRTTLERFDAVVADARYRALAEHPLFATTHQRLRDYIRLKESRAPRKLALPPPPRRY